MITAADVMPVLAQACPSFASDWSWLEVDEFHIDEETGARLGYLDAGVFIDHLMGLYRSGQMGEVRTSLDAIERLHVEGDAYVRELATIGYLESIQGAVGGNPAELKQFEHLLGNESARWWRGLRSFWDGGSPAVLPEDEH